MGRMAFNLDKERERFRRWAAQLELAFYPVTFDKAVEVWGLTRVVRVYENAYLSVQLERGSE